MNKNTNLEMPFWPVIKLNDIVFNITAIHFCVDFGGRQAQITTQRIDNGKEATFVYYWLSDECGFWDYEEVLQENEDGDIFLESPAKVDKDQPVFKMIEQLFDAHATKTRAETQQEMMRQQKQADETIEVKA